jgi:hypothetical protein
VLHDGVIPGRREQGDWLLTAEDVDAAERSFRAMAAPGPMKGGAAAVRQAKARQRVSGDSMSDILAMHKRLQAAGLSDAQSKVFLQLVADSETGRFDEQSAVDQLRAAQYSAAQGTILISELLRRLSRRAGGS